MAWTYSGNPAESDRDAVRFEVQDTDQTNRLVSDDEIEYALTAAGTVLGAAAHCCDALARRFAARVDVSITSGGDSVKRSYNAMAQTFAERARELRQRAQASSGAPWTGGTSATRKDALVADTDRTQPRFSRGQFDGPAR